MLDNQSFVMNLTNLFSYRDEMDSNKQISAKKLPSTNLPNPLEAESVGHSLQQLPVSRKEAVGLRLPRHPGRAAQTARNGMCKDI